MQNKESLPLNQQSQHPEPRNKHGQQTNFNLGGRVSFIFSKELLIQPESYLEETFWYEHVISSRSLRIDILISASRNHVFRYFCGKRLPTQF